MLHSLKKFQKKNHEFSFEVFKGIVVSTLNHACKQCGILDLLARIFFCEIKSKVILKKKWLQKFLVAILHC